MQDPNELRKEIPADEAQRAPTQEYVRVVAAFIVGLNVTRVTSEIQSYDVDRNLLNTISAACERQIQQKQNQLAAIALPQAVNNLNQSVNNLNQEIQLLSWVKKSCVDRNVHFIRTSLEIICFFKKYIITKVGEFFVEGRLVNDLEMQEKLRKIFKELALAARTDRSYESPEKHNEVTELGQAKNTLLATDYFPSVKSLILYAYNCLLKPEQTSRVAPPPSSQPLNNAGSKLSSDNEIKKATTELRPEEEKMPDTADLQEFNILREKVDTLPYDELIKIKFSLGNNEAIEAIYEYLRKQNPRASKNELDMLFKTAFKELFFLIQGSQVVMSNRLHRKSKINLFLKCLELKQQDSDLFNFICQLDSGFYEKIMFNCNSISILATAFAGKSDALRAELKQVIKDAEEHRHAFYIKQLCKPENLFNYLFDKLQEKIKLGPMVQEIYWAYDSFNIYNPRNILPYKEKLTLWAQLANSRQYYFNEFVYLVRFKKLSMSVRVEDADSAFNEFLLSATNILKGVKFGAVSDFVKNNVVLSIFEIDDPLVLEIFCDFPQEFYNHRQLSSKKIKGLIDAIRAHSDADKRVLKKIFSQKMSVHNSPGVWLTYGDFYHKIVENQIPNLLDGWISKMNSTTIRLNLNPINWEDWCKKNDCKFLPVAFERVSELMMTTIKQEMLDKVFLSVFKKLQPVMRLPKDEDNLTGLLIELVEIFLEDAHVFDFLCELNPALYASSYFKPLHIRNMGKVLMQATHAQYAHLKQYITDTIATKVENLTSLDELLKQQEWGKEEIERTLWSEAKKNDVVHTKPVKRKMSLLPEMPHKKNCSDSSSGQSLFWNKEENSSKEKEADVENSLNNEKLREYGSTQ